MAASKSPTPPSPSAKTSQNGYVTIDDIRLFTDNNRPLVSDRPEVIAQNDQQTLFASTPTILNLLANDQASDGGSIVNGTIELGTLPQHGALSRNTNGLYTYRPATVTPRSPNLALQ